MNFKINPTQQTTLILTLFALGALIANSFKAVILIHLCTTLGFGLMLFYVFKFFSKQNKNIWNAIISCLIIFLVLNYGATTGNVIPALIVTFITIASKFFLEYKGAPIFNPVVFGFFVLTILAIIFPSLESPFVSWWGASYKLNILGINLPFTLILIAIWMIFWFKNWKRWFVLFTYLIPLALIILVVSLMKESGSNVFNLLKFTFGTSTVYFFTSIMLFEPKTSPFLKNQQIIFGVLAAIIYSLFIFTNFPTSDMLAILIPNLYFFTSKILNMRRSRVAFRIKSSQTPSQTLPPITPAV